MQLIPCPWCGPREEAEFHYGGQAHVAYPEDPSALTDEEWARYVFFRENPSGPFAERWSHNAGCRRWFNAVRDTRTHDLLAVYRVGEPMPERVVRLVLLLKAASLARGFSGVREVVIDTLMALYNKGLTPVIPCQGSVGASGDLAPLAHLCLPLIGEGEVFY